MEFFKFFFVPESFLFIPGLAVWFSVSPFCLSHAPGFFSCEVMLGILFIFGLEGLVHFSGTPRGLLIAESRSPPRLSLSPMQGLTDQQAAF